MISRVRGTQILSLYLQKPLPSGSLSIPLLADASCTRNETVPAWKAMRAIHRKETKGLAERDKNALIAISQSHLMFPYAPRVL